jgi:hypothetical protein
MESHEAMQSAHVGPCRANILRGNMEAGKGMRQCQLPHKYRKIIP